MLLIVQFVQITRGLTTYEAMQHHGHSHGDPSGPEALSTFLTTGAPSLETAQLTPGNRGPDPAVQHPHPKRKVGYWAQFQTMLGIDTFLATALRSGSLAANGGRAERVKKNPFSRGWVQNFKDFWCDSQPVFGSRASGEALLGGEKVDYTTLFDLEGVGLGRRRRGGMEYVGVSGEGDEV
jgi:palmitoyltransferase ZDHHC13/17